MIDISGLTFDYPGHRALDDVTLTVAKGSVTALVGPNGAGKTTLIRCIAGLEIPLTGSITVDGMDVVEQPRDVHRIMGYLSDFYGLYQDLTVAQCLEYAAASQGMEERTIPAAVQRTAKQLDLVAQLAQASGSLSRGQRQRVAIGQAIIHQPKLLLLDEPASGLDPEARANLAALFRQLQAEGMTLLVSSHILAELDEYSTHILALREGRILENRALNSPHQPDVKRRLTLALAQTDARLRDWLTATDKIDLISATGDHAEFDFHGDLGAQAALLKLMIREGFAVSSLAEHKENLQQSYLRSVAAHLEGQP
ncbi:MAG: ABC transporter ATP-binding protein [Nitrosomonadales bacterium]|nr:ABC transporter ATP-binding protein [Nitrosomonadales bacterium]